MLLTMRSATGGSTVVVSVETLLAASGSVVPEAVAIVTLFTSGPIAAGGTTTVTRNGVLPPAGMSTVVAMAPVPLAVPQLAPAAAVHDHVTVRPPGRVSVTTTCDAVLGP